MKNIVKISTLAAVLMTSAITTVPAYAGENTPRAGAQLKLKKAQRPAAIGGVKAPGGTQSGGIDPTAHEWTLACYAEFGPEANYPDADLLEKCLNF